MKIAATIAVLWILTGLFSAGAINANFRGRFPTNYASETWARSGCAQSIGFGLFTGPVGFFMSPFVTGFYQFGWTLDCGAVKR